MPRRMRKPNYTHEETMVLLEHLDEHKHVIFGKGTNQQRADVWADITVAVNSLPNSAGRTKKELKHRWKDLTHRMRLLEKKIKDSEDEKCTVLVSPYYDLVMKILDEKNDSYNNSASNHSTVQGQEDCTHDFAVSSDHDIKPDKNLLYALVSNTSAASVNGCPVVMDTDCQIADMDCVNTKSFTDQCNSSSSNPSVPAVASKSKKPFRSQPGISSSRKCTSKSNSASQQRASAGALLANYGRGPAKRCRPTMRLDPYTQEVLAIDELDTDSDTDNDIYFPHSGAETKKETNCSVVENGDVLATSSRPATSRTFRKRKLSCDDESYLHSLSLEELKEVYLIKKIQMVDQRTKCFKLLEDKLEFQLRCLHQSPVDN